MTISSTTRKTALNVGNGVTTSFAFAFKVQSTVDIVVYRLENSVETEVPAADYAVTLSANQNTSPGGTVLFDTAPTSAQSFIISTDADATQEQNIQNQASFNPAIVMDALDKLTIQAQQLVLKTARSLRFPFTNTSDTVVPIPVEGYVLGWAGGAWTWATALASAMVSSFMQTPILAASAHAFAKTVDGTLTLATNAALTALTGHASNVTYRTLGATAAGDGGGGEWRYVAGSVATADSGMVLTATGGRLFRLAVGTIEARWYGAVGDGVTNDTAALNAWLAYLVANGAEGILNNGNYLTTSKLIIDESGVTTEELTRVSIRGEGDGNTAIQASHAGRCIEFKGGTSGGLGAYIKFSGVRLNGSGQVGGVGLWLDNCAWAHFEDMTISGFERGIDGTDVLASVFDTCRIRFNFMGFRFAYSDASRPNAIAFRDCIIGSNYTYGGLVTGGAALNIRGGSVEGNGQTAGVPTVGGYGIKLVDCGVEGATGLVASGVYCEGNADTADFWIVQTTGDVMHSISGCSFSRISSSYYATNNILFDRSGGNARVRVAGCGFAKFNTYVENTARRYMNGPVLGIVDGGNYYQSATATPAASDTRGPFCGAFDDTGASVSLPQDWTCVNSGTGLVTVTHNLGTTNYAVVATTIEAASERVERITKSTNTFIIVTTTSGEALSNAAANFLVQVY